MNVTDIGQAIRHDTILVSVMHVNNEAGTIQPIKEIGELLNNYPQILFHVDHVQGMGKVPIQLNQWHVDLCTISAHKIHGLKGTGILYIREGVQLRAFIKRGEPRRKTAKRY